MTHLDPPITSSTRSAQINPPPLAIQTTEWSDDRFEEVEIIASRNRRVEKVRDKETGAIVVRKSLSYEPGNAASGPGDVIDELKRFTHLRHTNIIIIHGWYLSRWGLPRVLMEYCEGGSLESINERIIEKNVTVEERIAGQVAEGILQGLSYLFSQDLIHNSLEPANILFSKGGLVKLSGHPWAEIVHQGAHTSRRLYYMSPEQIQGLATSRGPSDIWSAGVVLLEFVQKEFPWGSDLSPVEIMMNIVHGEPPTLADKTTDDAVWSNDLKDFLKQMLVNAPSGRKTAMELLEHSWIKSVIAQENEMEAWLARLWDWPQAS
ncbi:STE/STE-Unique protein kinase [Coprinopsis cinerea okayama7|uniref:STE/STE-Unique protein kinase n=1 Tax=Coprinopsis cinerea (strain Okayama-7 / 130 / ATCC MYA-4618 / FGSC 9003) TaxID=240176 RepID=A8NI42_COPC7|nr:STE/STE-Unique protein kinase [Coprinopsis cinerea okayama7\|eukprot:XP_001833902.2 STE/STE-Unique protein kinase [Coprinopsis cinerea okayama7\